MSKKRSHGLNARLVLPDNSKVPISVCSANKLLSSGSALFICHKPLTVKLVLVESIKGVLIPADCFNFKEDFTTLSGYRYDDRHRTKKPRKARRDPLGKDNRNYIYNYHIPDGELVAEEVIRKRKFGRGRQVGQY